MYCIQVNHLCSIVLMTKWSIWFKINLFYVKSDAHSKKQSYWPFQSQNCYFHHFGPKWEFTVKFRKFNFLSHLDVELFSIALSMLKVLLIPKSSLIDPTRNKIAIFTKFWSNNGHFQSFFKHFNFLKIGPSMMVI